MIYLGIDCGTQSTKTIALDAWSRDALLPPTRRPTRSFPNLPPGHLEQHPRTWIEAVDATVQQVLNALGSRRSDVRGIGVSGPAARVRAAGERTGASSARRNSGATLPRRRNAILIRSHFGGSKAMIEKVGMDMLPGYTAPKILWLKRHEPENFARLATVLLPHDYLNYYLTGQLPAWNMATLRVRR